MLLSLWIISAPAEGAEPEKRTETNAEGQITSETWLDTEDRMTAGPDGYARVEYEYEPKKNRLCKVTYLDAEGNLFFCEKAGYAVYERVLEKNRFVREQYYGADGKLCAGPQGYARVEMSYSSGDKPSRLAYFDTEGNPYRMPGGYYSVKREYAPKGRIHAEAYFDENGKPCCHEEGYHIIRTNYRGDGKINARFYCDLKGKWMMHPTLGYAFAEYYHRGGRLENVRYYNPRKKLIDCAAGYAEIRYRYNEEKQLIGVRYLHADETPALGPEGFYHAVYSYAEGERSEAHYYDTEEKEMDPAGLNLDAQTPLKEEAEAEQ